MRTKFAQDEYGAGPATAKPRVIEINPLARSTTGPGDRDWSLA